MPEEVDVKEVSETKEKASAPETEGQVLEEPTAVVEKTEPEEPDDKVEEGQPIPYERFKKVIDERNTLRTSSKEIETLKADNERLTGYFESPEVLRVVLKKQGLTDEAIDQKLKDEGHEVTKEIPQNELFKEFTRGEDLNTQEGWFNVMAKMSKHFSGQAVKPISQELSQRQVSDQLKLWEVDAKDLAKKFGIEYGEAGKTENDPNTAIGKISAYINKHPEDARLGHFKILKLAMSGEGHKFGEEKGVQKEKDRVEAVKNSQMEDATQVSKTGKPTSEDSIEKIMEYARTHPNET